MTLEHETDPLRPIPTKDPATLRAEIGPILRTARLKRGQSLTAVAQQTRISKRFLEALEENRFEQFPAVVYLRGFLKSYCEHLDINFEELWIRLDETATPVPKIPAAESVKTPRDRQPADRTSPEIPAQAQGSGATGAIVLSLLLLLFLCVYLLKDQGNKEAKHAPMAPTALRPLPQSIETKFVIRLKSDAWLRVAVDGQIVFEGLAPRDSVQEWKPSKFVDLRTTDPAVLELSLDGQPLMLGAQGADGQFRVEIH